MTIKAREFDRLVNKLGFQTRNSGDLLAWLEFEGRKVVRTRRSHGSGDLPMQHSIRKQLWLDDDQFREAISCHLTREKYIDVLRAKGVI